MQICQVSGQDDKMARTKTNTQNDTKHVEHHDATDIQNKLFMCFPDFLKSPQEARPAWENVIFAFILVFY